MRIPYKACPLCDAAEFTLVHEADCTAHALYQPSLPPRIRWMLCGACGHCFTDGYWTPEAEAVIFSGAQDIQRVGFDLERQRMVSARMIERVLPYRREGRWLDVGFGNASLLFTAKEFGFVPVGLDLREQNVRQLGALGIEAHRQHLASFQPEHRFDVISMADVLEHMAFPREALAAVRRLLQPGGVLYLTMPNMESDLWKAMDAVGRNPYWAEVEHFHNFGRRRLYELLREFAIEPARYGVSERYRAGMEVAAIMG
jgi:protein O-GlcNAc transferase